MSLHMTEIRIDSRAARQWAGDVGMRDADDGYLVHSLTRAAYGDSGVQPFAMQPGGRDLRILGYTGASAADLREIRSTTAEPSIDRCFLSELSKQMPDEFRVGRTMSFSLRAAPTRRSEEKGERDAYLFEPELDRYEVYLDWLRRRLTKHCEVMSIAVEGFELTKCVRRAMEEGKVVRRIRPLVLPNVLFSGRIRVNDPTAMSDLLSKGVGRHKAFGFGAMLLRAEGN